MSKAGPPAAKRSRKSADELMFCEGMDAVKDDRKIEALATAEKQETRESVHVATVNEDRLRYVPPGPPFLPKEGPFLFTCGSCCLLSANTIT
jgi:hypothetical protein